MENNVAAIDLNHQRAIRDARAEGMRQGKIAATAAALHMLVKNLKLTPQEAVVLLEINRKERKTYLKILATEAKRREERKKLDK